MIGGVARRGPARRVLVELVVVDHHARPASTGGPTTTADPSTTTSTAGRRHRPRRSPPARSGAPRPAWPASVPGAAAPPGPSRPPWPCRSTASVPCILGGYPGLQLLSASGRRPPHHGGAQGQLQLHRHGPGHGDARPRAVGLLQHRLLRRAGRRPRPPARRRPSLEVTPPNALDHLIDDGRPGPVRGRHAGGVAGVPGRRSQQPDHGTARRLRPTRSPADRRATSIRPRDPARPGCARGPAASSSRPTSSRTMSSSSAGGKAVAISSQTRAPLGDRGADGVDPDQRDVADDERDRRSSRGCSRRSARWPPPRLRSGGSGAPRPGWPRPRSRPPRPTARVRGSDRAARPARRGR